MYKTQLCLALSGEFKYPLDEQIRVFKRIGFDGFFAGWGRGEDETIAMLSKTAKEENMIFQSIHAPYVKVSHLWYPSEETEAALADQIRCVQVCAENDVPLMVAHAFIGFHLHEPTAAGIDNFGKVVREAERLGVKIGFENTEGEEYLIALMDAFKGSPAVGFCWDTGHQMCYNPNTDMMALYGDRLLGTHINDNLGVRDFNGVTTWIDDLHLLPFDGIVDWQDVAAKIKASGFNGPLTFELNVGSKPNRHENDPYCRMESIDYLTAAYIRACRVAALLQRA